MTAMPATQYVPDRFDELIQWSTENNRLIRTGLRNHDPVMVDAVRQRVTEKLGETFADKYICFWINFLMNTEGWDWQLPDGSPSPLL